jgi:hypothetical protein
MLVVRLGVWYSFLGRGRIFVCVAKLYSTVEKEGERETMELGGRGAPLGDGGFILYLDFGEGFCDDFAGFGWDHAYAGFCACEGGFGLD